MKLSVYEDAFICNFGIEYKPKSDLEGAFFSYVLGTIYNLEYPDIVKLVGNTKIIFKLILDNESKK